MASSTLSATPVIQEEEKEVAEPPSLTVDNPEDTTTSKVQEAKGRDQRQSEEVAFSRIKKRKMVLMLSYCGQGYYGMQKNPDAVTIEGEFFDAMLKNNYVDKEGYNRPQSFGFQRAARTDKHVSAARQIVSFKGPDNLDISKLNECLPACIRVMGLKRVTRGFDAKISCDARTYSYMLPTFAFAPIDVNVTENYRVTPEVLVDVRRLFQTYAGTSGKNFHNFTSKKRSHDPSAMRHIMSFDCGEPFMKEGLEYVILRVKGQSFMLHQIRKMIGLCIAILRGFANEKVFEKAFGQERIDIPRAPGVGLMLEEVHYHRYDKRYGSDGIHETITWDEVQSEVEKFCNENIYPVVTKSENEEKSMWNWLATLVFHTYAVREHEDDQTPTNRTQIGKAGALAAFEAGIDPKLEDDEEEDEEEEAVSSKSKRKKFN